MSTPDASGPPTGADDAAALRALLNRIGDGVVAFDRQLRFVYLNRQAARMLGRQQPADLRGRSFEAEFPEAVGAAFHRACERALATQQPVVVETHDAPWLRWFENRIHPSADGLTVHFTDTSAQRQAERALRDSEARFRHFFDAGLVGMAITVPSKNWGRFNDRLCAMLGYAQEELARMTWAEVTHPDDLAADVAQFERVLAGETDGYTMDKRFIRRDGSVLHAAIAVRAERDAHGRVERFFAVVEDISARKAAEEALRLKEAAIDNALSGIALAEPDGRLSYVNPAFCRMWGVTAAQALGTPATGYWAEPAQAEQVIAALFARGAWSGELLARRADGTGFHVQLLASLIRDGTGAPRGLVGSFVDVTDSRRAREALARHRDELEAQVQARTRELVLAHDLAQQASRAKSEFLSRMSHELRTPLNAVIGFGQLLEVERGLDERQRGYARQMLQAGRHLLALINDVLDLARIEAGRVTLAPEPLPLAPLLDECMQMVAPEAQRLDITLTAAHGGGLAVHADRTRLRQVLLNLLSNAIKYDRAGGRVSLGAESAGGTVRLAVSDTGPGLDEAQQAHLFEPFNRLGAERGPTEGTGIGLAISRQLVQMMGGRIGVESRPGTGSTFWVELPSAQLAAPADRPPPSEADAASRAPTVLYVEDNAANRALIEQIVALRRPHWRLLTAEDGRRGLALARAHRPDLLLLDVQLPDLDGYQLLARLRAEGVRAPAVALTAFSAREDEARALGAGFAGFLSKPVDIARLEALLDQLLARA